jgi:trk system potassium uptake protein TrkA
MRVAIVGAGAVGRSVARDLLEHGHKVLLIERRRSSFRPDRVPAADWLLADACEINTLEDAGIETCDVFMAATADDKANLVTCLLAKTEFGVPRVVARVTNPANEELFTQAWGVDVAVSTPRQMVAGFEEAVTVGAIVRLMTLQHSQADILELTLPEGTALVGVPLSELPVPSGASLLAVVRNGTTVAPRPDHVLQAGDGLFFVAGEESKATIATVLQATW